MSEPRISIIMPILNGERFIGDTVATVQAQTYGEWELLVVDGGSSDGTAAVTARISALDSRIRFVSRPGTGIWEAMYQGSLEARGEFVAILCASDGYVNSKWLGEVARATDAHPDVSLFWGIPFVMDGNGVLTGPNPNYAMLLSHKPRFWRLKIVWHYIRVLGQYVNPFKWGVLARKIAGKKTGSLFRQLAATPLPQKEAWLPYWLTTALIFPDGNMCVKKEVFHACAFAGKGENKLKGFIAQNKAFFDFYYNFSSRGYLPFCLPIPASFGRIHAGQVTQLIEKRDAELNMQANKDYHERVARLSAERLLAYSPGRDMLEPELPMDRIENKGIRLHLGCGENYLEGYVNVDLPPSENAIMESRADLYQDMRTLAYDDGSVAEVRAHHLLEHFSRQEALKLLLQWRRWLAVGGVLHVETPDFEEGVKRFTEAALEDKFRIARHLFGSQESAWAFHRDWWGEEKYRFMFPLLGFEIKEVRKDVAYLARLPGSFMGPAVRNVGKQIASFGREHLPTFSSALQGKGLESLKNGTGDRLANITVIAVKTRPDIDSAHAARTILGQSLVGSEKEILDVWVQGALS